MFLPCFTYDFFFNEPQMFSQYNKLPITTDRNCLQKHSMKTKTFFCSYLNLSCKQPQERYTFENQEKKIQNGAWHLFQFFVHCGLKYLSTNWLLHQTEMFQTSAKKQKQNLAVYNSWLNINECCLWGYLITLCLPISKKYIKSTQTLCPPNYAYPSI